MAREFVGRLMADPGFAQKLVLESVFAASASLLYEYRARGDRFKAEFDLAMINTIGMAAATAATVWLLAPTRSYGSVHKFPWQQVRGCALPSQHPTLTLLIVLHRTATVWLAAHMYLLLFPDILC